MKFVQLALLFHHMTKACAVPWIAESKGTNCALSSCPSKTVHVEGELKCGSYCGTKNCDFFFFENGVCTVYPDAVPALNSARYGHLGGRGSFERARGKPLKATPNYYYFYVENVLDGNLSTYYHSSDNPIDDQPWILIDLTSCLLVEKIRVMPVASPWWHALHFVDVQVLVGVNAPATAGDFSAFTVVGSYDGPPAAGSTQWLDYELSSPICSRYVALYKYVKNPYPNFLLEVVEIEVWTSY